MLLMWLVKWSCIYDWICDCIVFFWIFGCCFMVVLIRDVWGDCCVEKFVKRGCLCVGYFFVWFNDDGFVWCLGVV